LINLKKLKKGDIIYLEWYDASATHTWNDEDEIEKICERDVMIKQLLWVHTVTDKVLVGYSRITENDVPEYSFLSRIPVVLVKDVQLIVHILEGTGELSFSA